MNKVPFLLLACFSLGGETIVPTDQWIDDQKARETLEKIQSNKLDTHASRLMQEGYFYKALEIYEANKNVWGVVDVLIATQQFLEADSSLQALLEVDKEKALKKLVGSKVIQYDYCSALYYAEQLNDSRENQLIKASIFMRPAIEEYEPLSVEQAEAYAANREYGRAIELYRYLLDLKPDNDKLLLGLARTTAWDKQYDASISIYQTLIDLNPSNPVPRIEQARVAYWGKDYLLAMCFYQEIKAIPEREIQIDLEMAIRSAEWNHRLFERWNLLLQMLEIEPTNPTWKFEYAENLCSFHLCEAAADIDAEILNDVPLHTLAKLAYKRELQKQNPLMNLAFNYWQEIGYGDLSQIGRYQEIFSVEVPFSCTNKLIFSQHFFDEHTFYDNHFHQANGGSVLFKYEPNPAIGFDVALQCKVYRENFKNTVTGFAHINIKFLETSCCILGMDVKDEIYNYFNLTQKTQGYVCFADFRSYFSHALSGHAIFENTIYSDSNDMQRILAELHYRFTEHPKVLALTLTGEFRNTSHINQFIYNNGGTLVDIIHPYWAPQNYFFGQAMLQFRHDYGEFQFCSAPERYYDIAILGGDDTQGNHYCQIKGNLVYECFYHCKIGVSGLIHSSPMWNAKGLWCSLSYTF